MSLLKKDKAGGNLGVKAGGQLNKVLPYALSTPALAFIIFFLLVPLGYCLYCSAWRCDYMNFTKYVTIFYKGIMPSEKVLDFPVDCNTLTGSVNL